MSVVEIIEDKIRSEEAKMCEVTADFFFGKQDEAWRKRHLIDPSGPLPFTTYHNDDYEAHVALDPRS